MPDERDILSQKFEVDEDMGGHLELHSDFWTVFGPCWPECDCRPEHRNGWLAKPRFIHDAFLVTDPEVLLFLELHEAQEA